MATLEELKKERDFLNAQINAIEQVEREETRKKNISENEALIQKCYNIKSYEWYDDLIAFNVVGLSKSSPQYAVSCACIIYRDGVYSITRKDIWFLHSSRPMNNYFEEIDWEEFDEFLYEVMTDILGD